MTEYGAQRYCEDRSGPHTGYLAPPPPGLFTAGWLARDGDRIGITAEGRTALADYQRRRAAADALPYTMTRSPLRGELHRPDEPVRRLRRAATGEEIKPGDTVTDPFGHQATYLGPTMHSDDGGATWTPAFNARVTYPCHGAWLYPPAALGAFYEREFTLPGPAMTPTRDPRPETTMTTPGNAPDATASFPLLIGAQVEAYALAVDRQTCDRLAAMLRADGQTLAANLVEEDRDVTELSRSLAAVPSTPRKEHGAYCRPFDCRCGCDRTQTCADCHRCVCWRAQCCAQVAADHARRQARKTALRSLLDAISPAMLTELRETAADAEEAALRDVIARRVRLLTPAAPRWTCGVFDARDSKLGMGHADYSVHDVTLHDENGDTSTTADLDDDVLSAALGTLAELLRPEEGAELTVDLTVDLAVEDGAEETTAEDDGR
ncbi:hypothetical protein PUR49_32690 [Streptomyces sp. BE147]|uniref:hypothetical protein n=1 Tax=Streptomyces sp. BE147 TaxID=3002524 RepID=UPI002E78AE79|nr:hypothetical protein [Streptomyces sp. BE147]MEE1741230.1 hypothetical protein [Streptomyces sp. BE147]